MPKSNPEIPQRPVVFIGCSTQSIPVAQTIAHFLEQSADSTVWNEGAIGPGSSIIDGLLNQVESADFALFIFADEFVARAGSAPKLPDNVLFECGFFMGRLGPKRTFVVRDARSQFEMPDDLRGTVWLEFDGEGDVTELPKALRSACIALRSAITSLGRVQRNVAAAVTKRRVPEVLERGSSRFLNVIVDGALYLADTSETFHQGLKQALVAGGILPTKYLYCTDDGCELWLEICRRPEYVFNTTSLTLLQRYANRIVTAIGAESKRYDIDLISLGSGNGAKDSLLLRGLTANVTPTQKVYYYPVDVNAQMIVQAVKGAMNGVSPDKVAVKAMVADFTNIHDLVPIYEDRPNPNVFSVLGNTLGNSDEQRILDSVQHAMKPGDFLLLEVNTSSQELEQFLNFELNMRHDFVPLQSMGVAFDRSRLHYREEQNLSVVGNGTVSTLSVYEEAVIGGETYRDIKLGVIHHYDAEKLLGYLRDHLRLRCILRFEERGVGIFLLVRD
ncbi:MAG: L-histidine N(alpha)-methyltransferase [Gemmatimonadaceae bacterium]